MSPIISPHTRIRFPEAFTIGMNSIVDDFCYFSTQVEIGEGTHIASGCAISGGVRQHFRIGNYSSLSSGVKVFCASNDFSNGLVAIFPDSPEASDEYRISGNVTLGNYTGVGANSVVMPKNLVPEGVTIGALSFVPSNYDWEPWTVYAGVPIRKIKPRNKDNVMRQVEKILRHRDSRYDR